MLVGGTGADIFRYGGTTEGIDRLTDFISGTDALELSASGFGGGLVAGMDLGLANRFVVGINATNAFGQFVYNGANGALYWDADGTGAGVKVQIATLTSHPALSAGDLHVIL
jgi:Ca2+-binding RTX toxin-like protein